MVGRILLVLSGVVINGFAVSFYVLSGFGVSTISCVPFIVSQSVPRLSFGTATILFQIFLLGILVVYVGWHKKYIFSVGLGVIFGVLVDVCASIIALTPLQTLPSFVHYIFAFFMLPFGISLMLCSNLTALPFDVFVKDMSDKIGCGLRKFKTVFDVVCVVVTGTTSLFIFKEIKGIGIGTIISMFCTGIVVHFFYEHMKRFSFRR